MLLCPGNIQAKVWVTWSTFDFVATELIYHLFHKVNESLELEEFCAQQVMFSFLVSRGLAVIFLILKHPNIKKTLGLNLSHDAAAAEKKEENKKRWGVGRGNGENESGTTCCIPVDDKGLARITMVTDVL